MQDREDELAKLEKRLAALQSMEQEKTAALTAHRGDMATLLGALERLSIEPRETLLLGWRSPMDTVITAQLLGFAVPPIEAKAPGCIRISTISRNCALRPCASARRSRQATRR